ncbi:MAG: acyl-CoA dehydrogenase family protein [Campylobacteraceae bacterium]
MSCYKKAQEFAQRVIQNRAADIDQKAAFPEDIFNQIGNEGFLSLLIPKQHGGQGQQLTQHVEVCMALAESSATVALCYMMHNVALNCVSKHGSEKLKEKIFEDVVKNKKFLALAYSELGTGTHFYIPEIKAVYDEKGVSLTGIKSMVTSAKFASYYLVLSGAKQDGKLNNWAVPLNTKGVEFLTSNWNGLGMRANVSCPMKLENAHIDELYRIGQDGDGQEQVFTTVSSFFLSGLAAVYSGLSTNICNEALKHATSRKYPSGPSLSQIETVQIHLSNIYTKTTASRTMALNAASSYDNKEEDAEAKIITARILASESVIEIATIAMRVGGGKTYNKQNSIERLLRDAYAGQIMAPSVDVLKVWLGKALTGQQIP